jgi:hypothetical protein
MCLLWFVPMWAPAGGAVAAAPEGCGCARNPVGTHPHLLAVGVGNPIVVPCMAWLAARRGESDRCDPLDP